MISFIAIILFTLNSYAADETIQWTDFSKAKVEVTQKESNGFWTYYTKITGIEQNKNSEYRVFIKSGNEEPNVKTDEPAILSAVIKNEDVLTTSLRKAYELNKDVYCYIIEKQGDKYGTPYKTKLPRLKQHNLGSRINGSFFSDKTSTFFYEGSINNVRNIKVKIGTIKDNNVLLSVKNGETNCLQKLLDYSKSANSIYTGTIPLGESKSITSNLKLTNGEYYYVYMTMEDENGKYYPVEDVSLYQALVDNTVGNNLFDYLSNEFKWNIETGTGATTPNTPSGTTQTPSTNNDKTPSTTTKKDDDKTMASGKLPQTGIGIGLILLIIVSVSGLIFAYFKYDRLKGIK